MEPGTSPESWTWGILGSSVATRGRHDGRGGKDVLDLGVSVADGHAGAEDVRLVHHVLGRRVLADHVAQSGEMGRGMDV